MSAKVLTMGTFDLPHPGHYFLFRQCRKIAGDGGIVVVGLNPDEFITQFKGRPPIQTYAERFEILSNSRSIDEIRPTPGQDAKPLILSVQPDFIVIGSDWATKDYYAQLQLDAGFLIENDIALLYLDRMTASSSTELKARIRDAKA